MKPTDAAGVVSRRPYDTAMLSFRRQFVLGPDFVERFPHWKRLRVGARLCLTVHPDLGTCQAVANGKSVTLIGFVLDPARPRATDQDIIDGLLSALEVNDRLDDCVASTYGFGGRWILIVDNGKECRLFHDAAGLRQVFYTQADLPGTHWCASDPGVIADIKDLPPDTEARAFIAAYEQFTKEYWWPGDTSLYAGVRKLLPNHCLDLESRDCRRYWPTTDLTELPLSDCLDYSADTLRRMLDSAHRRFPLAVTVTAGWDSRLVLAASRDIRHDVMYFTLRYWELSSRSDDIRIPAALLPRLGVRHHVIGCPPAMDRLFADLYRGNVTTAHEVYGTIAQGLFDSYPADRVMVKGVVSEVARCWCRQTVPDATNATLTPRSVARAMEVPDDAFALRAYDGWLAGVDRSSNVDFLDLLFWEQRMGSWQSMAQLEWDIVQDVFTPFNCRTLLTHLLSVDRAHREPQHPVLYSELMKRLWPDVLSEPFNPSKKKIKVREALQTFVGQPSIRRLVPQTVRSMGRRFLYPERRFSRERQH